MLVVVIRIRTPDVANSQSDLATLGHDASRRYHNSLLTLIQLSLLSETLPFAYFLETSMRLTRTVMEYKHLSFSVDE